MAEHTRNPEACYWDACDRITLALGLPVSLAETFPEQHCSLSSSNCLTFLPSQNERLYHMGHCPWLLLADGLHWTLDLSESCRWCLTALDTFSGYHVVLVWSANACQSTVACEIDLCLVFGFLAHLHSHNGESFIAKDSQQCAASQLSVGVSVLSVIHRHPVLLSIETASSKIDWKIFLTLLLQLFLTHAP